MIALLALGCGADPGPPNHRRPEGPAPSACVGGPDERLFGRPTEATGLGPDRCGPTCTCGGEPFTARELSAGEVEALRGAVLADPFPIPSEDPYAAAPPPEPADGVCAAVGDPRGYRLETFATAEDAVAAGASVTHTGACGLCSTLADLAVYAATPDLTAPVRDCGLRYFAGPPADHVACLEDLGFTPACAAIWYYNTVHTRDVCSEPCLAALDAPYHEPDGSLNACLQCDEDQSGAVFLAVAGRTRRNTGLASSMCRPCDEVRPIAHDYPFLDP